MIKNKKQMFVVIGVFTLVLLLGTVTYAFFNYTRVGNINSLGTGRLNFSSTENGNVSLTNVFPMSSEDIDNILASGNNVTVTITGDTNYSGGIEYLVTAEDLNITVNDKKVPVSLYVSNTTDLGTADEDYFDNRGGNTSLYKVLSGGVVVPGQYLVVGYIAPGQDGIDGSLNIKAYIDKDKIAISDTYDGSESNNMGTTSNWVNNRTVFTTEEWNSIEGNSSLSFKVRVEANEGIWVDPYTTPNLMNTIPSSLTSNVKEIRFIQETPLRMQRRYDASEGPKANLTYQETGKVLAWTEPIGSNPTGTNNELLDVKPSFLLNNYGSSRVEQIDNETYYILYIASSGKTKLTTVSGAFSGVGLFSSFTNVERIVFENADTSSITTMQYMFAGCSKLEEIIGINQLDIRNVTNMVSMFGGCSALKKLDLSNWGSNNLSNVSGMFGGCSSLEEVIMKNFNFGTVSSLNGVFSGLSKLKSVNMANAVTNSVTNMSRLFASCTKLTDVDLTGLGSDSLTNVSEMFYNDANLVTINMKNFNFGSSGMSSLFANLSKLETINLTGANTTSVNYMNETFARCTSLTNVDLSGLGGNSLQLVDNMFYGCTNLKKVNMSRFNFGNATSLGGYTNANYSMFFSCTNLEEVDFSNAIMDNITDMSFLFHEKANLKKVDFTGVNTSNVSSMFYMFRQCTSLEILDLSSFNTESVTNTDQMFWYSNNLRTIYVGDDWDISGLSTGESYKMFEGCTSLVGGNGTIYNSSNTDATMAVIDTPSTPGYLTRAT